MKIKSYIEFIKESSGTHEFGCVMLKIPFTDWNEIISEIKEEDVYDPDGTHGREDFPHLTLLYGLKPEITKEQVQQVLTSFGKPINIEIEGIDLFENKDYDVVKFNVKKTPDLQKLHDMLKTLPNEESYPDYKPHITICYVNKGTGKNYINPEGKYNFNNLRNVSFSPPSGQKVELSI